MKKVIVGNDNAVKYFDSLTAAAAFLKVNVATVSVAASRGYMIRQEWRVKVIEKDAELFQTKRYAEIHAMVKEIFTRKPYSSTNIWRRRCTKN